MKNLSKNIDKYEAYKKALSLIRRANRSNDDMNCVTCVAIIESMISDRLNSFIEGKKIWNNKINPKSSISKKIQLLKRYYEHKTLKMELKFSGRVVKTTDLLKDIEDWIKKRNSIIHSFGNSKTGESPIHYFEFFSKARDTSIKGEELLKLVLKWHGYEKRKQDKIKI